MNKVIQTISKNSVEQIWVELSEYMGKDLLGVRTYYHDQDTNQWRPTRKGVTVKVELLPELLAALHKAEAEASAAGLLADTED